jgi:hypothetical protein
VVQKSTYPFEPPFLKNHISMSNKPFYEIQGPISNILDGTSLLFINVFYPMDIAPAPFVPIHPPILCSVADKAEYIYKIAVIVSSLETTTSFAASILIHRLMNASCSSKLKIHSY